MRQKQCSQQNFETQASHQNTYLYGGFFDTIAHLFSQILPLDRYDANHLCNAMVGLLGVVAASELALHWAALQLDFLPRYSCF